MNEVHFILLHVTKLNRDVIFKHMMKSLGNFYIVTELYLNKTWCLTNVTVDHLLISLPIFCIATLDDV